MSFDALLADAALADAVVPVDLCPPSPGRGEGEAGGEYGRAERIAQPLRDFVAW